MGRDKPNASRAQRRKPTITLINAAGRPQQVEAVQMEIDFGGGRRMVLDFPDQAWGDLDIQADTQLGTPLLTIQPAACNLITLRVDARHDMIVPDEHRSRSPYRLDLTVQKARIPKLERRALPKKKQLVTWTSAALERDASVTLRFVGEAEGQALNLTYRGKDYATNVLTFVYESDAEEGRLDREALESALMGCLSGDVVLCVPVIAREAQAQGKTFEAHCAHMVIHAMLHLQGFDHESSAQAKVMEKRERDIMALIGFGDPYANMR